LRGVVARLLGRGSEKNNRYILGSTFDLLFNARNRLHGKLIEIDGGVISLRAYKVGTLHLDIAPDIALAMNRILAKLYPTAIPDKFRTPRPARKTKPVMVEKLLPIPLLEELWGLRLDANGPYLSIDRKKISKEAQELLLKLDGKPNHDKSLWHFPYEIRPVLTNICDMGKIPDDKSFQFYPTPEHIAERLIELLDVADDMVCLEPSAGTGAIAKKLSSNTMCYELSTMRSDILKAQGLRCENVDFLDVAPQAIYDRIAMNPPFDQGRAMHHFRHALKFLKPGGIIGAILPNGYYQKGAERVPYEGIELEHIETMHEQFGDAKVYVQLVIARKSL
jgi:predicted RNA methylase